jgi:VanZ family protein
MWAYLIFYNSSIPAKNIPCFFPFQDIIYHFIVYFIFAILLERAIINTFREIIKKTFIITFTSSLVYAFIDEVHQIFVAGRCFSLWDISVDVIGIFWGIKFYRWLK